MSRRTGSNAFTLIELLVVISIISLLIALLLPALKSSRTAGQLISATSSSRQIMIGLHTYANDNKSVLPWCSTDTLDFGSHDNSLTAFTGSLYLWNQRLYEQSYITSWQLFWSPGHALPLKMDTLSQRNSAFRYNGFGANHAAMPPIGTIDAIIDRRGQPDFKGGLDLRPVPLDGNMGNSDPSSYKPSQMLVIVDTSLNFFVQYPGDPIWSVRSGTFGLYPGVNSVSLFTYNDAVASAYLDGHASSTNSELLGWRADSSRTGTWIWNFQSANAAKAPWFHRNYVDGILNILY